MKNKKQYLVLGLGRFGKSIATALADAGQQVMAVDENEQIINEMADVVSQTAIIDITAEGALSALDPASFDVVIVAVGQDKSASIMTCVLLKELGAKYLVAKAADVLHAKVLTRIGVDRVVRPEKEMGERIAISLCGGNFLDMMELADGYSIVELHTPDMWIDQKIGDVHVRRKWGVNILGIRREDQFTADIQAETVMQKDDVLILMGSDEDIERVAGK